MRNVRNCKENAENNERGYLLCYERYVSVFASSESQWKERKSGELDTYRDVRLFV